MTDTHDSWFWSTIRSILDTKIPPHRIEHPAEIAPEGPSHDETFWAGHAALGGDFWDKRVVEPHLGELTGGDFPLELSRVNAEGIRESTQVMSVDELDSALAQGWTAHPNVDIVAIQGRYRGDIEAEHAEGTRDTTPAAPASGSAAAATEPGGVPVAGMDAPEGAL